MGKKQSTLLMLRLPPPKKPSTVLKLNLKIFSSNTSVSMQLLSLPRDEAKTLTRLSANGRLSLMTLPPKLMLAKRNAETTTANFSALKLPGMKQLDVVKRENKNLADEIKDLLDQLGDGGRSIH